MLQNLLVGRSALVRDATRYLLRGGMMFFLRLRCMRQLGLHTRCA